MQLNLHKRAATVSTFTCVHVFSLQDTGKAAPNVHLGGSINEYVFPLRKKTTTDKTNSYYDNNNKT